VELPVSANFDDWMLRLSARFSLRSVMAPGDVLGMWRGAMFGSRPGGRSRRISWRPRFLAISYDIVIKWTSGWATARRGF
jgi:hypothetical protein